MQHSGENLAQSYSALIKSSIYSTVGVSLSRSILYLSNASGFSLMYFSSLKKKRSLYSGIYFPCPISSLIYEWRIVATELMIESTQGMQMVVLM